MPSWAARSFVQSLAEAFAANQTDRPTWTPTYRPHPKQQRFHNSEARFRLYGGAAGGGKTRALREELVRLCLAHHGLNCYLMRRTYPELEQSHIRDFREQVPADWYTYNEQKHGATFRRTRSRIWFSYCDSRGDVYRYQSAEMDVLAIDELTHLPGDWIRYLWSRMRSTGEGRVARFIAATNPGGVGHHFVRSLWVDRDAEMAAELGVDLAEFEFIRARLADNPTLREREPEYERRLDSLPEAERAALRDGSWDSFAGQFFTSWSVDRHVIAPCPLPAAWPRVRCIDYGATQPLCCLWLARDPAYGATPETARVYVYREHYQPDQTLAHHVRSILRLSPEGESYRETVADPSMWSRDQETQRARLSLADQAGKDGLQLKPAINDRVAGWQALAQLMEPRDGGLPGLRVFNTCRHLIRTLPQMQHDRVRVEDLDTTLEDHAADALRYGLMALLRPGGGRPTVGAPTAGMASGRMGRAW